MRRGEITLVKASELLGLSYRQAKRCFGRYQEEGDRGLVHRLAWSAVEPSDECEAEEASLGACTRRSTRITVRRWRRSA